MLRLLQLASLLLAVTSTVCAHISPDDTCGGKSGYTCSSGSCCSQYGWCGKGSDYCNTGCQSQWGDCSGRSSSPPPSNIGKVSTDGECGSNGRTCDGYKYGLCCSQYGYCGDSDAYCGKGCQEPFGQCKGSSKPSTKQSVKPSSTKKPSSTRSVAKPTSTKKTSSVKSYTKLSSTKKQSSAKSYTKSTNTKSYTKSKSMTSSLVTSSASSDISSNPTSSSVTSSSISTIAPSSTTSSGISSTTSSLVVPSGCGVIPNGGFEDAQNVDWLHSIEGSVSFQIPFQTDVAIEGTQVAYLEITDPTSSIAFFNTITGLVPGFIYTISFSTRSNLGLVVEALVNGQSYLTVPSPIDLAWIASTFTFQATSESEELRLVFTDIGSGSAGALVDAVSIACGSSSSSSVP